MDGMCGIYTTCVSTPHSPHSTLSTYDYHLREAIAMAMAADTDTDTGNGNDTSRPRGDMDNHKPSSRDTYITYIHTLSGRDTVCVCVCVSATTQIAMHVCVAHLAREGAVVGEGEGLHVCINPFDAFI